ncbi:MAG: MerR family transcriptional regulator [Bacteroidota bacterium]
MAQEAPTYSIGEVAKRTGVKAHTLRYWETEFDGLQPAKDDMGNRTYSEADIAFVERIRYLLYEAKYTQEGARQVLNGRMNGDAVEGGDGDGQEGLWALRGFLVKLLQDLDEAP